MEEHMEGRGLIIGIEYDNAVKQACVYDMRINAPVACEDDFCRLRAAYIEFFIKEKQPFPLK